MIDTFDAENMAITNLIKEDILSAMNSLQERDKKALTLRYFEGKTYASIGVELGVCGSRARQIVNKALRRMNRERQIRELR